MTISSQSRIVFLLLSCLCCLVAITMLVVSLFSADFRWVRDTDIMRGTKSYGLIRYCFEPEKINRMSDDSNGAVCYLRTRAPANEEPIDFRQHYGPFEMTTLILLSVAVISGLAALCFAICTIFTKFGAFSHSICMLAAAICSAAGFITFSYFMELRENQREKISDNFYMVTSALFICRLQYHYGWAYYLTGASAAVLLLGFVFSLLGSAFVFVHSNNMNRNKVESIPMGTRL